MALDYTFTPNNRESRPRSKRLRELGVGGGVGGSNVVTVNTGGANTSEGHSHDNKSALDQITTDKDGYQWLTRDVGFRPILKRSKPVMPTWLMIWRRIVR